MTVSRQTNIAIYQGDDWAGEVTVLNQDGTPADLTDYTAQAQIRRGTADETRHHVVAEMTCVVEPMPVGVIPNLISLSLTHQQTRRMRAPGYSWDLQIVSPTNEITTLLAGRVTVTREITRETPQILPPEELLLEAEREVREVIEAEEARWVEQEEERWR